MKLAIAFILLATSAIGQDARAILLDTANPNPEPDRIVCP
jgi:hypothetical protein